MEDGYCVEGFERGMKVPSHMACCLLNDAQPPFLGSMLTVRSTFPSSIYPPALPHTEYLYLLGERVCTDLSRTFRQWAN